MSIIFSPNIKITESPNLNVSSLDEDNNMNFTKRENANYVIDKKISKYLSRNLIGNAESYNNSRRRSFRHNSISGYDNSIYESKPGNSYSTARISKEISAPINDDIKTKTKKKGASMSQADLANLSNSNNHPAPSVDFTPNVHKSYFQLTSRTRIDSLNQMDLKPLSNNFILPARPETVSVFSSNSLSLKNLFRMNNLISSIEAQKIPLSPEVFYSEKQREINNKLISESAQARRQYESGIVQRMRRLTERKKEIFILAQGERENFKIRCIGKSFPLNITLSNAKNKFDLFCSHQYIKPNEDNFHQRFRTEPICIEYPDDSCVLFLYFTLVALKDIKTEIIINFPLSKGRSGTSNYPKKLDSILNSNIKPITSMASSLKLNNETFNTASRTLSMSKGTDKYNDDSESNFFMTQSQINFHFGEANESYSKIDIIKKNKEQVKFFHRSAYMKDFQQKCINANLKLNNIIDKKKRIDQHKKQLRQFGIMKPEIRRITRMFVKQEKDKIDKLNEIARLWLRFLVINSILREIKTRFEKVKIFHVLQKIKEQNARIIQRLGRKFLYEKRPLPIESMNLLNIMMCINIGTSLFRVPLQEKANLILTNLVEISLDALKIKHYAFLFKSRIEYIQKRWRSYQEIFNLRVNALIGRWDRCMIEIIEHEKKFNKNKWRDVIPKFTIASKKLAAKKYVRDTMREHAFKYYNYIKALKTKEKEINAYQITVNNKQGHQRRQNSPLITSSNQENKKNQQKIENNDWNKFSSSSLIDKIDPASPLLLDDKTKDQSFNEKQPNNLSKNTDNRPESPVKKRGVILSKFFAKKPKLSVLPDYNKLKIMVEAMLDKISKGLNPY